MVFQNYALYPHMTVYENMAFGLKLRKMPKDQIDARVKEAARILGITEYLDRKPKAMSGGQRQRVALGRAIVRETQSFPFGRTSFQLRRKIAYRDAQRNKQASPQTSDYVYLRNSRPGRSYDYGYPYRSYERRFRAANRQSA